MLFNKEIIIVVLYLLSFGETARQGLWSFTEEEVTALRDHFLLPGTGRREEDPTGPLIQGRVGPTQTIQLAKHHVMPEHKIREGLKALANDPKVNLKTRLERYINDQKNIDSKTILVELVGGRTDSDWVKDCVTRVISWNPNNLRAGPLGDVRKNDPGSNFDDEVATNSEKTVSLGNTDILNKLTNIGSLKNPTWEIINGKWIVKDKQGTLYSTARLINSAGFLNIKTGIISYSSQN